MSVPRYPNHECACDDEGLSQATDPVVSENGRWVQITCGWGHRRSVSRQQWEAELQRRAATRQEGHDEEA